MERSVIMKGRRLTLGKVLVNKIYDGSIRGIEDNKTVGIVIGSRKDAMHMAKLLLDYCETDTTKPLDITFFKRQRKDGKYVATFTHLKG